MSATCEVIATIVVEGAALPQTPLTVCSLTVHSAPPVCATAIWVNALLQAPAAKEVVTKIAEAGCDLAVEVIDDRLRLAAIRRKESAGTSRPVAREIERAVDRSRRTYRALNSRRGMSWLLDQIGRR